MPSRDDGTRAALGAAAVVSPRTAAEWLPGRDAEELLWLRKNGLIRERVNGSGEMVEYVLWGEVLATLGAPRAELPERRVVGLRRSSRL